jgi:hypothetical protein
MYFDKERDDFNIKLANKNEVDAKDDVDLSTKFVKTIRYLKLALAAVLLTSYFLSPEYLVEVLICGMVLTLLLPQGFTDTYLEKLSDLRAAETDQRQTLNAAEANKHFDSIIKRIESLERSVEI